MTKYITSFKEFLKEMPQFVNVDLKVECPYEGHIGDRTLIGGNSQDVFDLSSECLLPQEYKDKKYSLTIAVYKGEKTYFSPNPNNPKKIISIPISPVPMICVRDLKIFMWNALTNKTYAPKLTEDILFCEKIYNAINSPCAVKRGNNNHFNHKALTILEPHEEI